MKAIALCLLLGAAAVYAVAHALSARAPAWSYVAAFAEAAMVGAVADWFAVVALFRHPLGLRIPHTAIIPTNKDRIGRNLATFLCANFLSNEQVLKKVEAFDAAGRAAAWLADPRRAAQLARHLGQALRYGAGVVDDARLRQFFGAAVLGRLERVDGATLAAHLLELLTSEGRHQHLLDAVLRRLARVLDDDSVRAAIAEIVASELKVLRYVGLDSVAGRYLAQKIAGGVARLVGELGADPTHPLRERFDDHVAISIERLRSEPALRERVAGWQREALAHPAVGEYLNGLWSDLVRWLEDDLGRNESVVREQLALGARAVGAKLGADAAMREWINGQLRVAAPRWIERYREDIRLYIIARVAEWNADEMTDELERNIGRDLQFIRINGTLVGGLVGLAIHALTQWLLPG
ncbi:DUF445 domain-containing protein [Schlegelella sp. ID0723]|uniref:DUF445 domain-containing protein n=2 Tax=Piscinibacter koreensis TaxID=2742824 RepID=A0A7Y6TV91_9BURK|nr:DUF445 domain-containing protein [Schlegelella koreensis]NUZ04805.1 DUF445 domain-containing protein [Schlegelella koreensis]